MKQVLFSYAGAVALMILAVHASIASKKATSNQVAIDNFSFRPDTLTVPVGTTVTWINRDEVPHTVVNPDKKMIVSPALDTDEKFSYMDRRAFLQRNVLRSRRIKGNALGPARAEERTTVGRLCDE